MDKSLRNCSNCAHSYGKVWDLKCHRTGTYCSTEMQYGSLCNNRKTGELQLWADKEANKGVKEESTSLFKKVIKLVKGE